MLSKRYPPERRERTVRMLLEHRSEVNSKTQAWQTQLMLGIITDADKASLTAWTK